MKVHLQRYGVVWFLLAYWSLSFVNEYFLRGYPLSAEAWQGMRLLALLVTASLAITLTRLLTTDASDRQEAAVAVMLVTLILHLLALLLPAVWLFYQWQWYGRLLLQWQGTAFGLALAALPAAAFFFSS
ncbi:hypothetical protein MC118_005104 [Salmonella enterica]|nr:hypothetical protein [Salmonella enterica]